LNKLIVLSLLGLLISINAEQGYGEEEKSTAAPSRIYEPQDADYDFFKKADFADIELPKVQLSAPVLEPPSEESNELEDTEKTEGETSAPKTPPETPPETDP